MSKTNAEKIIGLESRVVGLEIDISKIPEEAKLTGKKNNEQFAEVLHAISFWHLAVVAVQWKKQIDEKEEFKDDSEFELEFGSFKKGTKDDKNMDGSRQKVEYRKIKALIFEGEDVFGWIYKGERFCEILGIMVRD